MINKITLLTILLAIQFCTSSSKKADYEDFVKNEMKIQHVFPLPSNAWLPGTLVQYTKESGYQKVCNGWDILGKTKEDYSLLLIENQISDTGMKSDSSVVLDLQLTQDDWGKLGADYKKAKGVQMNLRNGKMFTLENGVGRMWKAINDVERDCIHNLGAFLESNPNAEIYLILSAFSYDISYSVVGDSSSNTGLDLSPQAKEFLQAKLNAKLSTESKSDFQIVGEKLFIGFNGLKKKVTNEQMAAAGYSTNLKSLQSMLGNNSDNSVPTAFDLTEALKSKNWKSIPKKKK